MEKSLGSHKKNRSEIISQNIHGNSTENDRAGLRAEDLGSDLSNVKDNFQSNTVTVTSADDQFKRVIQLWHHTGDACSSTRDITAFNLILDYSPQSALQQLDNNKHFYWNEQCKLVLLCAYRRERLVQHSTRTWHTSHSKHSTSARWREVETEYRQLCEDSPH